MRKITISDVIFWLALIILIGYIIVKLVGLINTPEWVELIPIITIIFIIGALYQKVLSFMDLMNNRTNYIKRNLDSINNKITEHDKRLGLLEK